MCTAVPWKCEYVVRVLDSTCGRWGMNCAAKEVMIALHSLAVRQWRCELNALPLSTPLVIHSANQQCRFRVAVEGLLDVQLLTCAGKYSFVAYLRRDVRNGRQVFPAVGSASSRLQETYLQNARQLGVPERHVGNLRTRRTVR